jgi:hypothetical protein
MAKATSPSRYTGFAGRIASAVIAWKECDHYRPVCGDVSEKPLLWPL